MDIHQSNDIFSTATLLYTRLRRVSSRVIDVMYLTENLDYAKYVIALSLATQDVELHRLAKKIENLLLGSSELTQVIHPDREAIHISESLPSSEPTQQDIDLHLVSHRYIGSLR